MSKNIPYEEGNCNRCGKHIADWPEDWAIDVTLYCPECYQLMLREEAEKK